MSFAKAELEEAGFVGWVPFERIAAARPPDAPGVYVVHRQSPAAPIFLGLSGAGWFKGKNPSVDLSVLGSKWVDEANVVYIGKATTLRSRLRQYQQFGSGRPVGHWGGRFIWQLSDNEELLVAWKQERDPGLEEGRLLRRFVGEYGRLPFANIASGQAEQRETSERASATIARMPGRLSSDPSALAQPPRGKRFVVAGKEVWLTKDAVEAAMHGVRPEPVGVHGVRIGGNLFPVVQVLERVTGIARANTRSVRARAVLKDLGLSLVEIR